jgi:c-di-GMP-binding flagellar brake protein YcgR
MDAVKEDPNKASGAGVEANSKLKRLSEELIKLEDTAKQQGKDTRGIKETAAKVAEMNREVLEKCLGLKF